MANVRKMMNQELRERLKEVRKAMNMTQAEFGKAIGMSDASISFMESGRVSVSETVLLSISKKFSIYYEWLSTGAGSPEMMSDDSQIEMVVAAMEGEDEIKKHLIRLVAALPSELIQQLVEYWQKTSRE